MAAEIAQSHSLLYNPIAVGAIHFYWDKILLCWLWVPRRTEFPLSWSSFGGALGISTHVGSALRGRARGQLSPSSRREGSSSRGTGRDTPPTAPCRIRNASSGTAPAGSMARWPRVVGPPCPPRVASFPRQPGLPDEHLVAPLHVACQVGAPLDMARIRRPRPGLAWFPQAEARGVRPAPPVAADGDADLVPRRPAWLRPVRLAQLVLARERWHLSSVRASRDGATQPRVPAGTASGLASQQGGVVSDLLFDPAIPFKLSHESISSRNSVQSAAGMRWDPDMAPVAMPRERSRDRHCQRLMSFRSLPSPSISRDPRLGHASRTYASRRSASPRARRRHVDTRGGRGGTP